MADKYDSAMKLQRRAMTPLLSKKVPPIPSEEERVIYPERTANFFSQLYFIWMIPLLNVGYKRTLQAEDLYKLPEETKVEYMTNQFRHYYHHQLKKAQDSYVAKKCKERGETPETSSVDRETELKDFDVPKIVTLLSLFLTFKWQYTFACACVGTASLSQCLSPLLTRELINYVEMRTLGVEDNVGKGVGYALGAVLMTLLAGLCINHGFYRAMLSGAQMKAVITKAILDKSFKLNPQSRHEYPSSKITSMMGTDASRIDFAAGFQPFLITFILPLIAIIVVLIVNIGVSALVGIALLFVFLVLIGLLSKKAFAMRGSATKYTDLRVDYIKEVLNNLKIIKFYSWEDAYFKNIADVRTKEMKIIYIIQVLRNLTTAAALTLSLLASMAAFLVLYAVGSGKRNPANIFSSISLFNVFTSLVFMVPLALSSLSDAFVGINRIGNYLAAEELEESEGLIAASPETIDEMDKQNLSLRLNHASFEWETFEQDDDDEDDEELQAEKEEKNNEKRAKRKEIDARNGSEVVEKSNESSASEKNISKADSDADASTLDSRNFVGLSDIDFNVTKGEFIVITGLIGSGKSSLLNAISGFMKRIEGDVDINGTLVLCGQPWIQNTTVKENIVFGSEFDEEKYKSIIYSCSLESDLEILPAGDRTEIGERGITLSGGQKARINLARSVYADKEIVLLDDVLSAVDARVGKHIMENCMLGLLKDKTRILATHQLSLIGSADRIIFLNGDGSISIGTFDELEASNEGFKNLMAFNSQSEAKEEEEEEENIELEAEEILDEHDSDADSYQVREINAEDREMIQRQVSKISTVHTNRSRVSTVDQIDEEAIHRDYNQDQTANGRITEDENKAVNSIGFDIYRKYVKLGEGRFKHYSIAILILSFMMMSTFSFLFTNTWLSFWLEYKFPGKDNGFYIGIYIMFTALSFVLLLVLFVLIGYLTNHASRKLNIVAIERVLHSPMSFLDTTPMGRIINRFTKDTDVLDNEISDQLRFFLFSISNIIGVLILCVIYLPWFAIAIVPFFLLFFLCGEYYQSSAREIKRLEAVQRSFVYNNFNETLVGMTTIKAYKAENRFLEKNNNYINKMNEAYYVTVASQRWVGVNLELLACILPLIITFLSVFRVFNISPASTGLVVSYVIQIAGQVAFLVRSYTQVENGMNSTERLCDFAYELDEESPYLIPENTPAADWPQAGGITFDKASLAYRPGLPLVLKDLDFKVKPQEKIGICGRTGAGKSSIMTALYRLAELDSGKIFIDDVDISKLGLKDLRTKLSIIPQDPVLFRGSIRKNLDPFGQSSDSKLWDALRRAGLIEGRQLELVSTQIKDEGEGLHKFHLDQSVEDDGANFSLGERQLIALARALVRDSKILILDEATSSVDYETDAKIQETIIREFGDCTILCIAHRLKTIVNYDKILVLDKGEIREFDTPWNLFNVKDSIFQQMCHRSKIDADDFIRKE